MAGQGRVNAQTLLKAFEWAEEHRPDLLKKADTAEGAKLLRKAFDQATGGEESARERKQIDLVAMATDPETGTVYQTGIRHNVENTASAKGFAAMMLRAAAAKAGVNVTVGFQIWERIDHSDALLPKLAETGDPAVVDSSAPSQ